MEKRRYALRARSFDDAAAIEAAVAIIAAVRLTVAEEGVPCEVTRIGGEGGKKP